VLALLPALCETVAAQQTQPQQTQLQQTQPQQSRPAQFPQWNDPANSLSNPAFGRASARRFPAAAPGEFTTNLQPAPLVSNVPLPRVVPVAPTRPDRGSPDHGSLERGNLERGFVQPVQHQAPAADAPFDPFAEDIPPRTQRPAPPAPSVPLPSTPVPSQNSVPRSATQENAPAETEIRDPFADPFAEPVAPARPTLPPGLLTPSAPAPRTRPVRETTSSPAAFSHDRQGEPELIPFPESRSEVPSQVSLDDDPPPFPADEDGPALIQEQTSGRVRSTPGGSSFGQLPLTGQSTPPLEQHILPPRQPAPPPGSSTLPFRSPKLNAQPEPCPDPQQLKKIADVTKDIRPSGDLFPPECFLGSKEYEPRSWESTVFTWRASAVCHKPLYFEETQLERYGHTRSPYLQPFISAANFFGRIPLLPYGMGLARPSECQYPLGYYRPGSCAPFYRYQLPIQLRGTLLQAGAVAGLVLLIP